MLSSFKGPEKEKDKNAAANAAEVMGEMEHPHSSVVEQAAAKPEPTTKAGMGSCIGSGMSIVGNIECNGPAKVFGRIEGELRASDLLRPGQERPHPFFWTPARRIWIDKGAINTGA